MVARLGQGHRVCSKIVFKLPADAAIFSSGSNAAMDLERSFLVSLPYKPFWSNGRKKVLVMIDAPLKVD